MKTEDPIEWLNWDQTMRLMSAANVGSRPSHVLADWCGQGLVETKAATLTAAGKVNRDVELEPALWRMCTAEKGAHLDAYGGSIQWAWRDPETKEATTVLIMGTQFRKAQLLDLVSHIGDAEVAAALAAEGPWLEGRGVDSDATPKVESKAGRKPERERWQAFYFAVIQLAQEGRLNADNFNSAAALVDEIQFMMGDGAFSTDHIKGVTGQIFKRFIGT